MFTRKQIWKLLIPLMIEQLLGSLMGTADTMMVSTVGSAAISAVSLVDAINILMVYVFSAMATGGTIVCAQYLGRGMRRDATDSGKQLLLSVLAISLAVSIAFALLRVPLLKLIFGSVEPEVMRDTQVYFLITALTYPFIALYNAGAALFRVDGNSRLPMIVSTASNLVNIALNALFIFRFRMGVAGAALATLISRVICAAVTLGFLRQPHQSIFIRDYLRIRPDPARILNILRIGIPTGIENGMFQFGKLAIQSTISTLSTTAIAAQAMTNMMDGINGYMQVGIGLGLMTIVGQCMGAGRTEEARKHILRLTGSSVIATVCICSAVALLVGPIVRIAGMESAAAELTIQLTWINCIAKPLLWSTAFIPVYGMRAAGDVRFSMVVSSSVMWSCRVVVSIVLIRVFKLGPLGMWIGMYADWAIRTVIFGVRFFSGKWTKHQVISA